MIRVNAPETIENKAEYVLYSSARYPMFYTSLEEALRGRDDFLVEHPGKHYRLVLRRTVVEELTLTKRGNDDELRGSNSGGEVRGEDPT